MPLTQLPIKAVLALSALLVLSACGKQAAAPEPVRAVRTMVINTDSAGMTLEYPGDIRARVESRLSFRVGGKVLTRKVNLGDSVRPGQLLAQLDPQDLLLAQEGAKAGLSAARTNRDQMGADYKRFIELKEQGFISAAELERRENGFKAAQAQLDQVRAQSDAQGNQTGYAQLVADAAGVVTGVFAEPGMVVGAGTPVIGVAVDGPRDVVFSVPEDQLGRVRDAAALPGALKVRLWGDNQKPALEIKLREISAATDPITRTFLLKADAGRIDAHLGQTAIISLALPRTTQTIKVPLAAVLQAEGQTSVWVLDSKTMTVAPKAVQVGGADGNEVVVASGLSAGQEIVTAGVHVLTPGQKVTRYQETAVPPAVPPAVAAASR